MQIGTFVDGSETVDFNSKMQSIFRSQIFKIYHASLFKKKFLNFLTFGKDKSDTRTIYSYIRPFHIFHFMESCKMFK